MAADYRFGVSEFTTWPWSLEQDLRAYHEAGVDAIEVTEFKLKAGSYAAQLETVRKSGLAISSVQTTVHSLFSASLAPEPSAPEDRFARIQGSLRDIAPHVPPGTPFVVITGAAPGGNCARVIDTAKRWLRELADVAMAEGVRLAFEPLNPVLFHTDTALWSLADGLELVAAIDHPALGLCVDLWNIWQTPDLRDVIARAASRIFLVQISDWRVPRANADRRTIGEGVIPCADIVSALRSAGYAGPYVLEIFSDTSLPDSLWRGDMSDTIKKNIAAFAAVWQRSAPQ